MTRLMQDVNNKDATNEGKCHADSDLKEYEE